MPELIDKAKVLKYLTPRIKTETPYGDGYNKALEDSAELVALMPAIEPEVRRWIPCIERLPEQLQNVIVCTDINTVTVAWLNGDHWTFADTGGGHTENWSFDVVKYWMYLPEPPEGEQK